MLRFLMVICVMLTIDLLVVGTLRFHSRISAEASSLGLGRLTR